MQTAREIMSDDVVTIQPESSIQDAIELLLLQGISGLPVTDNVGNLIGIVTEFALLAIAYDDNIRGEKVAQHMTTDVLTVEADDSISKVADLCIVHRVRRVPVVESGRLVGLISRRDVLKSLNDVKSSPVCAS